MRRLAAPGVIDDARGRASLEILQEMPLHRHLVAPLLPRIWDLKHNLTAYDAAYVALAESLECPVVTFDARISHAPGVQAEIIVPAADPGPPTV